MERLGMPDEQNIESFREMIFAAIRLDILLHVRQARLTEDALEDIHEGTGNMPHFVAMVSKICDALSKIDIDPNSDAIDEMYEARLMERISIGMTSRQAVKTGFERAQVANDPATEETNDVEENDGQPRNNLPAEQEDDYVDDGFDLEGDGNAEADGDGENLLEGNEGNL
jgi:hypothetical protein